MRKSGQLLSPISNSGTISKSKTSTSLFSIRIVSMLIHLRIIKPLEFSPLAPSLSSHPILSGKSGARNFYLGGPNCDTNIFIKITQSTHICIHTLFYYIYTHKHIYIYIYTHFLFDKLYIHTHTPNQKKNLLFSIKIMFDGGLSQIKIQFHYFHSEILKKFHFQYKLSNFILK